MPCSYCKKPEASLPVDGHFPNEPADTQHLACSEPCQRHINAVFQGSRDRQSLANAKLPCPLCRNTLAFFCGGPGSYWVECSCGHFSDLAPDTTSLSALCSDPARWHKAEVSLNCYPPIGG
jgi:hypothetical protein